MIFAASLLISALGPLAYDQKQDNAMQHHEVSLAMEFLAALGRLDFDAASFFLDENAVLDLPYANDGVAMRGRDDILRFLKKTMTGAVARIEYKLERAYPSPEAGAIVLEISTQGHTPGGRQYTNRLVAIFEFRDGKIGLFREYFNPVGMG